jgi:hypothetical protein
VCTPDLRACNGKCVDVAVDTQNCGNCGIGCSFGQRCVGGQCVLPCPIGRVPCDGTCVDTQSDHLHCNGCFNACPGLAVCLSGQCVTECNAPLLSCGDAGICVDPRFDPNNCGDCGNICPPVENAQRACGFQGCSRGACAPGFADCNNQLVDGCEMPVGDAGCPGA